MEDSGHHSASDTNSSSTSTIISSSSKYSDASIVEKDDRIRALGDAGRCSKSTSKNVYRKGRKVHGNRYTKKGSSITSTKEKKKVHDSRSHKKVIDIPTEFPKESIEGYRIIDMGILRDIINNLNCPGCNSKHLLLFENTQKKKGLASYLSVKCCICGFVINRYTSSVLPNDDKRDHRGMKTYDINARSIYALRSCEVGHTGLEKICGLMNLPKPVARNNYDNISNRIGDAAKFVAERSMIEAAEEENRLEGTDNISVSVDGTWQKRGFASLNGVVIAIGVKNGKVIDGEALSGYCKACIVKEDLRKVDEGEYKIWKDEHNDNCSVNYVGSAPNMESTGALRIFERSQATRGVIYANYYGDGDSKSFQKVKDIYESVEVTKFECIGHYQKRVGNRLRKF